MKKLCFVATVPAAIRAFMKDHIRVSAEKWSIKIVANPDGAELLSDLNAQFIPLAIKRKPALWSDLRTLVYLAILFRRERFELVHSITPKAGLLTMLAGWFAGVPVRMHTFTGQVWATRQGWKRGALKMFDRLIVLFATHILVDSPSQRDFLVAEGVLSQNKGLVIGQGSICGVDSQRFHPDTQVRDLVRAELGIGLEQIVILFLGRLNCEKGVLDLATAFADVASRYSDVVLVLVGAEEDVPFSLVQKICGEHHERLRRVSFTAEPQRYMAAADIFCLPSYREGFGQVIIEAAASGVPTVASRIYGITDAVEDGRTGLLFPAGNVSALAQALLKLIVGDELRRRMGGAARARALSLFSSEKNTEEMLALYGELLCRPSPGFLSSNRRFLCYLLLL